MTIGRDDLGAFFLDAAGEIWEMVAYTDQPTFCLKKVKDEQEAIWLVVGSEQAREWRRLVIDGGTIVTTGADPAVWHPNGRQTKAAGAVLDALTRYRTDSFDNPEWLKLRADDDLWPKTIYMLWGVRAYLDPELPADIVRVGSVHGTTDYSLAK